MSEAIYMVFGDLHGRVLPAFRLATVWARDHGTPIAGILQVGDLGFFPDASRLDKATRRFAQEDPMELGVQLVTQPSKDADQIFAEADLPEALWFTAGNHEDFKALESLAHGDEFAVDAYQRICCIRDGHVATLPGGLRVGALWGIDNQAPVRRRNVPAGGQIQTDSAVRLGCQTFDVLLTHDSPRDGVIPNSGSLDILGVIRSAKPAYAFFGHYGSVGRQIEGDFGNTQVFHLSGMEMRRFGQYPEEASVGLLRWGSKNSFSYLDPDWLRIFSRHSWRYV
jgi:hypothetical protein